MLCDPTLSETEGPLQLTNPLFAPRGLKAGSLYRRLQALFRLLGRIEGNAIDLIDLHQQSSARLKR